MNSSYQPSHLPNRISLGGYSYQLYLLPVYMPISGITRSAVQRQQMGISPVRHHHYQPQPQSQQNDHISTMMSQAASFVPAAEQQFESQTARSNACSMIRGGSATIQRNRTQFRSAMNPLDRHGFASHESSSLPENRQSEPNESVEPTEIVMISSLSNREPSTVAQKRSKVPS